MESRGRYQTYAAAQKALEAITCFFLPPPADLGCAAMITEETGVEGLVIFLVSQVDAQLLDQAFCVEFGACTADEIVI